MIMLSVYSYVQEVCSSWMRSLDLFWFFDFFLRVFCNACLFVVAENFDKQVEPVDLERLNNTQVEAVKSVEKAKFRDTLVVANYVTGEKANDPKGQADESEVEPVRNHDEETHYCRIIVVGAGENLEDTAKYVGDEVEPRDYSTDANLVGNSLSKDEEYCGQMMN